MAMIKKANVEWYYSSNHATLNELRGQMHSDKMNAFALRRSLAAQQAAFTQPRTEREKTSYRGQFVNECVIATVELLVPDKVKLK